MSKFGAVLSGGWTGPCRGCCSPSCLAQEVDSFSNFKTKKTGLGISGSGYVLLLQCAVLVMLTVSTWQGLLPLGGRYGLEPAFAQCLGACLWGAMVCTAVPIAGMESSAVGWELGEDRSLLHRAVVWMCLGLGAVL